MHQKKAVAMSQFLRARRLSSSKEMHTKIREKIEQQLRKNNYPNEVIKEADERSRVTHERATSSTREASSPIPSLCLPFKTDNLLGSVQSTISPSEL